MSAQLAQAKALKAATAAIYFADSSDYLPALWDVVRSLSPEIAEIAERDARAAWQEADALADAHEAAPQQAQAPTPGVCDLVQVEGLGKLPRSDAESWLRHRAGIIEACRAEGYSIVTTAQGVHLMKLGKIAAQAPGWQLVPVEPTPGLLMSMALRFDHGLGCPGYYDQFPRFPGDSHQLRLEGVLTQMRQIYEEVSGTGFYRPELEESYKAMAARQQGSKT